MAEADPPGPSRIFISYRREDSAGHVLALLPALRDRFGADRIFKDTDNIPPGVDFVKFIKRELESCSVMLAIIGRDWLTVQDPRLKRRRLDNPDDFLRLEVTTALKNERIRVIPVLVDRGVMPNPEDLPPDLAELSLRNALELSDSRWESDVNLLIQAIKRASTAQAQPAAGSSQRPELQDLQRRRAREIGVHLQTAQDTFEAGDYEATLWACEKALVLDPEGPEALELMDRARKAIDDRKIDAWLTEARQLLNGGDVAGASELIDQALAVNSASEPALTLRQELLRLRRERERDRERARVADAARERARASLDEEDFEAALRHADDALALDSTSAEAQEIRSKALTALDERRRQREHKRRAQHVVTEARAKFATGQHEEALRLLREFGPTHELVSLALLELQKEADVVDQRQQRIAGLMRDAATAMANERFQDAVARLREVALIEPDRPDVAALLSQAEAGHTAAVAAEGAQREADASLSARQTVEQARQIFKTEDHKAAIDLLERFSPSHALVSQALGELREQIQEIERRRRRQEDEEARRREKVERAAAVRNRAETLRVILARGRENLDREDFEAALRDADEMIGLDPHAAEAQALRSAGSTALEQRIQRDERDRLAQQAAAKARAEAAQAAEQRRHAEARSREELRRHKEHQAREERIQQSLAEGQSAFTAGAFRDAKTKASEVLELAPDNETARALLTSATRELRASTPPFWSTARVAGMGAAAAVLLGVTIWLWYGSAPSGPVQPAGTPTSASATSTSTPGTSGTAQPPTRGGTAPPPVVTPPPSTAPSGEPSAGNLPAANEARLQRLVLLRETARRQLRSAQRDQALNTAVEGLQIDPKDPALQSVLDALLRDAQSAAQRAKDEARTSGADSLLQTAFTEALKLEDEATRLRTANRKDPAIRSLWNAADRFALAARQATTHAMEQKRLSDDLARKKQLADTQEQLAAGRGQPAPTTEKPTTEVQPRPPAVNLADEERLVRATLQQYESAYTRLSAVDVQRVYPSVRVDQVVRAFADIRSYDLKIQIQTIAFSQNMTSATVLVSATHDVRARAGAPTRQTRGQTFTLEKQGNAWVIVQVR